MKKIMFIMSIVIVFLVTGVCSAMSICQPIKLGTIHGINLGGYAFKGAISVSGNVVATRGSGLKIYGKGIALYGDKNNELYIHYGHNKNLIVNYGDKLLSNTIPLQLCDTDISMMKTDTDITLYVIYNYYDMPSDEEYTLIGKRQDGKFVKYLNINSIFEQYFGKSTDVTYFVQSFDVNRDTIIFKYLTYKWRQPNNNRNPIGEIRCKWDEKAQWFAVENVVY